MLVRRINLLLLILSFVFVNFFIVNLALAADGACKAEILKGSKEFKCYKEGATVKNVKVDKGNCESTSLLAGKWYASYADCSKEIPAKSTKTGDLQPIKLPEGIGELSQLGTDAPRVIGRVIKGAMGLVGSAALVMFIYGGILWMTSGGNAERAKKAVKIVLWSALGLVVVLASYAIVDFVFEAFK